MAVYFGVGDKARKVSNLYIGVGDKARKIKAGWIGVGDKARLFYSAISSTPILSSFGRINSGLKYYDNDDRQWHKNSNTRKTATWITSSIDSTTKYVTLGVKAQNNNDKEYHGMAVASAWNPVNFSGVKQIRVTYTVNSAGADSHTADLQVKYGDRVGSLTDETHNKEPAGEFTAIGSGHITSANVGKTLTNTYNVSISGSHYLALVLVGNPGSRSTASAWAANITIKSVELIG